MPMRPILLKGHERSITLVKYNADGDILFTCSKDSHPTAWWSDNGERIGTYEGHNGTVWDLDCTRDNKLVITGSADASAKIWNAKTGEELVNFVSQGPVRAVGWNDGATQFFTVSLPLTKLGGATPRLEIFDVPPELHALKKVDQFSPTVSISVPVSSVAQWMPWNKSIVLGCDDGSLQLYDPKTGEQMFSIQAHENRIHDLQFNNHKSLLISSSKDCTAKVWDTKSFKCQKTIETDRPVNSAAISPKYEHVMLGGGQEAIEVTTTSSREGKFEVKFFHLIFKKEFGVVKGHFGPINTLAFHPDGTGFASGAEDGYVRLHKFDSEYLALQETEDQQLEKSVEYAMKMKADLSGKDLEKYNNLVESKRSSMDSK